MDHSNRLHNFGTLLLWAGVLVWLPFFILQLLGESPSFLLFLPFHLTGVLGGTRMRTTANKRMGKLIQNRSGHKRIAHYLIIASILVWLPYYAIPLTGHKVDLTPFLTLHLIGVFSGMGLMGIGGVVSYFQKANQERGFDIEHSENDI